MGLYASLHTPVVGNFQEVILPLIIPISLKYGGCCATIFYKKGEMSETEFKPKRGGPPSIVKPLDSFLFYTLSGITRHPIIPDD